MHTRRGFTLAEIMISITLMLIVTGAIYQMLVSTQRLSRGQAERVSLQSNVRTGVLALVSELRELGTVGGGSTVQNDLLSIAPDGVTYRAMRGIGFICQAPTATQIRLARSSFSGFRDPQAGRDSVFVFFEGSADTDLDDSWTPFAITAVSTATACPGGAGAGITLSTDLNAALPGLEVGTPLRIYEVMELRLYQADGKSWLGARSVSSSENIQPVLGPLTDGNGLRLEYLDGAGVTTADLTAIKSIRVAVRGISEGTVNTSGWQGALAHVEEELVTQVALRNALR